VAYFFGPPVVRQSYLLGFSLYFSVFLCRPTYNCVHYGSLVSQMYIQGGPKNLAHFLYALELHQVLTNFQTFFTVRIRKNLWQMH